MEGWDLLKKWICWELWNGENIEFWKDLWISTLRNFKITSQKPEECNVKYVKDVIDLRTREWNEQILQNIISTNKIKKLFISNNQHEDKIRWQHEKKKGNYFVKSGYHVEIENQEEETMEKKWGTWK